MSDKLYNTLIGKLAGNRPEPESAGMLTDRILANLPERKNKLSFLKSGNSSDILIVFRMVTSTAALFLIVFFILQQRDIESKLTRLEKQVAASDNNLNAVPPLTIKAGYLSSDSITVNKDGRSTNLVISRRSLNYLLEKIKSLEEQNKTLQQRFIEINQPEIKK